MVTLKSILTNTTKLACVACAGAALTLPVSQADAQEGMTPEQMQALMAQMGQQQQMDPAEMERRRQAAIEQQRKVEEIRKQLDGNKNVTPEQEREMMTFLAQLLAQEIPLRQWNFNKEQINFILAEMAKATEEKLEIEMEGRENEMMTLMIYLENRELAASIPQWREAHKELYDALEANDAVKKTESGLYYEEKKAGTGPRIQSDSKVTLNYVGTLPDGTEFDSTKGEGREPIVFDLGDPMFGLVPGFTEGLLLSSQGTEMRLVVPAELGYGLEAERRRLPVGSPLIFELEILKVENP